DPSRPLRWDDLESSPFLSVADPPRSGSVGTVEGKYRWTGTLPAGKSGEHVVYTVWSRSDSTETFYSCSDVVFDGGNGQVTGMGSSGTTPTGTTPAGTTPAGGVPACSAEYRTTGSWRDGYQGEIVVTNTGPVPLNSWMVHFALPAGQSVGSAWNATVAPDGQSYTASALGWNERLATKASTAFGFTASGGEAPAAPPSLHCMPS
ncbi:MAG: hypothetical protein QG608_2912, partial [Actinomycetota bacterium]|nr:hypothetical protein [Actinomycetota bacterium]